MFARKSSKEGVVVTPLAKRSSLMCLPENHLALRTSRTPPLRSKLNKDKKAVSLESILQENECKVTEHEYCFEHVKVKSWAESFNKLLEDARGVKHFLLYLETEHSSENIRFWIECEKFKKSSPEQLFRKAKEIYKEYLCGNGYNQVNIDSSRLKEIKMEMEKPNAWTFDQVQHDIFLLMKRDSYPRFLKSTEYERLLKSTCLHGSGR